MAESSSTRSKPSTRSCADRMSTRSQSGASLIEMLVAVTVAGLVAAGALSMALSTRRLYSTDERRTDLNQQLRTGMDLLGVELRQSGQGLPQDFPALEIADGGGTNPDTVTLRRNLHGTVLPVCGAITAGTSVDELRAADSGGSPPAGCTPLADTDADGWPDNIDEWRDHRTAQGGAVDIYVFNPVSGAGQFVEFDGDGSTGDFLGVDSPASWQISCLVTEQCRAYILEEHRYVVNAGVLRYSINGNVADTIDLIDHVTGFQAVARFVDGSSQNTLAIADDWSELRTLEITLSGQVVVEQRTIDRTLTSAFLPRNVISL